MKDYRVSLEFVTSRDVTSSALADLLGVAQYTLSQEPKGKGVLWSYEPSTGQTGKIGDRLRQLAGEVCPREALRKNNGVRKVSLGIEVFYDTATCTVVLHMNRLVFGTDAVGANIPELSSVELTCHPSNEDLSPPDQGGQPPYDPDLTADEARNVYKRWKAAGRPARSRARSPLEIDQSPMRFGAKGSGRSSRTDKNEYIVSLDAITSASATRSEVAAVLGLPPYTFMRRRIREEHDRLRWMCIVEADQSVGIAERLRFLSSAVHPRRSFEPGGKIKQIFLNVGVLYDVDKTETCSVRLPMSSLRSLVRKLLVFHVEVTCYPCREGEHDEEARRRHR